MALAADGGRPMTEHDASSTTADSVAPMPESVQDATTPAPQNEAIHDDLLDGVAGGGGAWTRIFSGR